ncbi:hypothetical protein [Mesorhizobium loti]|uniref:hypothetical protein n=1 Tax=Rhizobium loti TaxID=381 RepID=UPI0012BBD51C|nr:hypothetical protein [Mesorhizobium loti]
MTIQSMILADNPQAAWRLSFIADELDLFIEVVVGGTPPAPQDRISIDDFLALRPVDRLHEQALDMFVRWLSSAMCQRF